jgi:hypothetical protein
MLKFVVIGVSALALAFYVLILDRWMPENAAWFGQTGLAPEIERELPKYLRREFGHFWFSESPLKASDLRYVGAFNEGDAKIHYWSVPWKTEEFYARVTMSPGRASMGWGGEQKPPQGVGKR